MHTMPNGTFFPRKQGRQRCARSCPRRLSGGSENPTRAIPQRQHFSSHSELYKPIQARRLGDRPFGRRVRHPSISARLFLLTPPHPRSWRLIWGSGVCGLGGLGCGSPEGWVRGLGRGGGDWGDWREWGEWGSSTNQRPILDTELPNASPILSLYSPPPADLPATDRLLPSPCRLLLVAE